MKTKTVALATLTSTLLAMAILPAAAAYDGGSWTVQVLLPTPYQVVTAPYLQVWIRSSGYRMDARYAGTPDPPTVGHVHEILDGRLIDMVPVSAASSVFIIAVTVLSGSLTQIFTLLQKGGLNAVPWNLVLYTIPGAVIGGQLGSKYQGRISSELTERLIAALFLLIGLAFLVTAVPHLS